MNTLTMAPMDDLTWPRFEHYLLTTLGLVILTRLRNKREWIITFDAPVSSGDQTSIEGVITVIQYTTSWS